MANKIHIGGKYSIKIELRTWWLIALVISLIAIWQIHTIPLNSMSLCRLIGQSNVGDACYGFVIGNINALFIAEHVAALAILGYIVYKVIKAKKKR